MGNSAFPKRHISSMTHWHLTNTPYSKHQIHFLWHHIDHRAHLYLFAKALCVSLFLPWHCNPNPRPVYRHLLCVCIARISPLAVIMVSFYCVIFLKWQDINGAEKYRQKKQGQKAVNDCSAHIHCSYFAACATTRAVRSIFSCVNGM